MMLANENSFFELSYKGYLKESQFLSHILEMEKSDKKYSEKELEEISKSNEEYLQYYENISDKLKLCLKKISKMHNTKFNILTESYVGKKNNAINNIIEVCYTNPLSYNIKKDLIKLEGSLLDKYSINVENFTDNSILPIDYMNYISNNPIFLKYVSKEKFLTDDEYMFKQKVEFCKSDKYAGNLLLNLGFEKKQEVHIDCYFFELYDSDIKIRNFIVVKEKSERIFHFEIFTYCPEYDTIRLEYLIKKMKIVKEYITNFKYVEFSKNH